jgi:hypothetical protein
MSSNKIEEKQKKIIIYTPSFDINTGGIIALHRLCHLLREDGVEAFLWPDTKPYFYNNNFFRTCYRFIRYFYHNISGRGFRTYSQFETPIAKHSDLIGSIVVYSEGVRGNPLLASNVVRWFLHKPGFHTGEVEYGSGELYFYFNKSFNDPKINDNLGNRLRVVLLLDDIYKQTNFGKRAGECYIIRKGKVRSDIPDLTNKIIIDHLSHEEIANVFNTVECCISYDSHTMYSRYAVMCGCKSIVVPENDASKDVWRPNEELRYGISYGFDDLKYAEDTKKLLFNELVNQREDEKKSVQEFIKISKQFFSHKKL